MVVGLVKTLLALAGLLAALVLAGCGASGVSGASPSGAQLSVTTTTNWITDTARQIGGNRVEVQGLMGPGVDPHLYQARASDVDRLRDADVVLWNGLELEAKMEEIFAQVGQTKPVVAVGEAVPEPERLAAVAGNATESDPHVWFDPGRWAHAARAVAEAFKEADPEGAAGYDRRLSQFLRDLDEADSYARSRLGEVPERSRVLVTSHDAFGYFADAYGFEVASIQGISTEAEATTADVERVASVIADRELGAVFVESSVPRQTIDAVLAAAARRGQDAVVGGELFGDAAGSEGSEEGTYVGALRHNVDLIAEGLAR
jgi:manganese/zinc/iron transport system substrate-binding protein